LCKNCAAIIKTGFLGIKGPKGIVDEFHNQIGALTYDDDDDFLPFSCYNLKIQGIIY
jgi:hypothetical protein